MKTIQITPISQKTVERIISGSLPPDTIQSPVIVMRDIIHTELNEDVSYQWKILTHPKNKQNYTVDIEKGQAMKLVDILGLQKAREDWQGNALPKSIIIYDSPDSSFRETYCKPNRKHMVEDSVIVGKRRGRPRKNAQ